MSRLGLVVAFAVVLVGATPAPNTNGALVTPSPTPRGTMKATPTPPVTPTPLPTVIRIVTPTPNHKITPTPTATATPTPTPTPIRTVPPKVVLSDTIQFDGPQFCRLTSDVSDRDGLPGTVGRPDRPGPQPCRIVSHGTPTGLVATISVPGDPNETITFKYTLSGSTVSIGAARESEGPISYPATITGTIHGAPGGPTSYGMIKVWELSTAP